MDPARGGPHLPGDESQLDRGYFMFCVIWLAVSDIFFSRFDNVDIIFDMRSIAI